MIDIMDLTLFYKGTLKSSADLQEKQRIRSVFHEQLKELWKRAPFKPDRNFYKKVGDFNFLPLVVKSRHEVTEINIIMLRPTPPGAIVGEGGDIDNRIKTLFDSLRMPNTTQELPKGDKPADGQDPFYCLLEDDRLITKLSVSTDRLLVPNKNDVFLLIHVQIKQLRSEFGHMRCSI